MAGVGLFIIFSVNQARILENLGAWNMSLTEDEFAALEAALTQIPVHGHRSFVEQQGKLEPQITSKSCKPRNLRLAAFWHPRRDLNPRPSA